LHRFRHVRFLEKKPTREPVDVALAAQVGCVIAQGYVRVLPSRLAGYYYF